MYPGLLLVDMQVRAFLRIVKITKDIVTVFTDKPYDINREAFEAAVERGILQPASPYHFIDIKGKITEEQFLSCLI